MEKLFFFNALEYQLCQAMAIALSEKMCVYVDIVWNVLIDKAFPGDHTGNNGEHHD
jgi:hypothetical protein